MAAGRLLLLQVSAPGLWFRCCCVLLVRTVSLRVVALGGC
jgi:hypothetical protein